MSIYNTPLEERFGEKLEELREGKNMTREQLADQVGLTARHIAALERGERRPTLNTMEKLLRTLGAPTEWLVYPEFEEQNARLREISHLAATFSDEQQEFLLGMMRLMRKQKFDDRCGAVGGIAGVAATGAAWGCELFDVFWGGAGDLLVDTGVCRGW